MRGSFGTKIEEEDLTNLKGGLVSGEVRGALPGCTWQGRWLLLFFASRNRRGGLSEPKVWRLSRANRGSTVGREAGGQGGWT